jgi:lactosylceramide 4-alpha-galactosyltransferase
LFEKRAVSTVSLDKFRRHALVSHVPVCFQASELSTQRCNGFQILSNKEFFPVPYQNWELFFEESGSEETMEKIKGSFGVHFWNKLSRLTKVLVGSRQPYSLMAARACPRVYSACGHDF